MIDIEAMVDSLKGKVPTSKHPIIYPSNLTPEQEHNRRILKKYFALKSGETLVLDTIEDLPCMPGFEHRLLREMRSENIPLKTIKEGIDTRNPYITSPNSNSYYPAHAYFVDKKYEEMLENDIIDTALDAKESPHYDLLLVATLVESSHADRKASAAEISTLTGIKYLQVRNILTEWGLLIIRLEEVVKPVDIFQLSALKWGK